MQAIRRMDSEIDGNSKHWSPELTNLPHTLGVLFVDLASSVE